MLPLKMKKSLIKTKIEKKNFLFIAEKNFSVMSHVNFYKKK